MSQLSPQQLACVEAASKGRSSLLVTSCAGSGKTTVIVEMLNVAPGHTTVCAFNVRNKEDLEARIAPGASVATFNGLGHRAWGKRIRKFCKPERFKTLNLADKIFQINSEDFPDLTRAVGMAKAWGLVPSDAPGGMKGLVDDTPEEWQWVIEGNDLDCGEYKIERAAEIIRTLVLESIRSAWKGEIDFDDQIYMSAIYEGQFEPVENLGIDEVQDVAPIQRLMFKRMKPQRIFAVGDPHQAIYAFRGADFQSIDNFMSDFSCETMALTVSFRCPKAVVREAKRWVDHIESAAGAPEGSVSSLDTWGAKDVKSGDVILCRNNRPLFPIAMDLLKKGIGVKILGREIGEGLLSLVKKQCRNARNLGEAIEKIKDWQAEARAKAKTEVRKEFIDDKASALIVIAHGVGVDRPVRDLEARIDFMFDPKRGQPVTLSSVHKAKGFEWQRVLFLDSHLIPSRFAKTQSAIEQENNIAYVGVTRAKRDLVFVNSDFYQKG